MPDKPSQSSSPLKPWLLIALTSVPVVVVVAYFALRTQPAAPPEQDPRSMTEREQMVEVGGVKRPASDLVNAWTDRLKPDDSEYEVGPPKKMVYGHVQKQTPDANPAVASVYDAATKKQHPERLTPMVQPKAFDKATYEADPQAYLSIHEPGRVFQSAQPGPGITVIEAAGRRQHLMTQGESVRLKVKTDPGMPVTFASFDIGTFDNGLATISVAADDQGIAEANFNGSSGKVGEVNILAASPVAAERVKFDVFIRPPKTTVATTAN